MKFFYGFALAFNMLTIFPIFKIHHFFQGINGYSAMFYPLVGFLLGGLLWGIHFLLQDIFPPLHLSVIIFVLWIVFTGAIHLDGLSDTIDGLFVDRKKALKVMKDSYVGGMGMIFTFTFLLLKLSSVLFFKAFYLLPIILMLSRFNSILAIYFFPYISRGVGALLKEELHIKHILFSLLYVSILTYYFHFFDNFFFIFIPLFLIGFFFTQRLQGLNGDIYGFLIEITEVFLLQIIIIKNFV